MSEINRTYYIEGRKYELKSGEETPFPFNSGEMYVYLNDEMFVPVESEEEFQEILERANLTEKLKE